MRRHQYIALSNKNHLQQLSVIATASTTGAISEQKLTTILRGAAEAPALFGSSKPRYNDKGGTSTPLCTVFQSGLTRIYSLALATQSLCAPTASAPWDTASFNMVVGFWGQLTGLTQSA